MIGDEVYKGKPVFEVNFIDFCRLTCRDGRRTKFTLDNKELLEHIINTRYSKKYVVKYCGILYDPESFD